MLTSLRCATLALALALAVLVPPLADAALIQDSRITYYGIAQDPYIDLQPGRFELDFDLTVGAEKFLDPQHHLPWLQAIFRVPRWSPAKDVTLDGFALASFPWSHDPAALMAFFDSPALTAPGTYRLSVKGEATGAKGGWLQIRTNVSITPLPAGAAGLISGLGALSLLARRARRQATPRPA